MAVITEAAIRELAAKKGDGAPITSCYLDVDGRRLVRQQDLEKEVAGVLRGARERADGIASVQADLERVERLVASGLDRSHTRGLAIFACSADGLWEVVELPVPVTSRVVINHAPAVGQLEAVLQANEPIGVLLVDRHRARLFVFELGELVERSERFDDVLWAETPRGVGDRGDVSQVLEEHDHQNLRRAAEVAFGVWQRHPYTHLAVGAPDSLIAPLEAALHPYLRDRLCGRVHVPVAATHGEVLAAAQAVEADVIRARDATLVDRLRAEVASGRRGVAGLEAVVAALGEHRVETLLVSDGYRAPGWRCESCGRLATMGRQCKNCGAEMVEVEDLAEDATEEALAQSCRVVICSGNADLDVLGRIGALLRY